MASEPRESLLEFLARVVRETTTGAASADRRGSQLLDFIMAGGLEGSPSPNPLAQGELATEEQEKLLARVHFLGAIEKHCQEALGELRDGGFRPIAGKKVIPETRIRKGIQGWLRAHDVDAPWMRNELYYTLWHWFFEPSACEERISLYYTGGLGWFAEVADHDHRFSMVIKWNPLTRRRELIETEVTDRLRREFDRIEMEVASSAGARTPAEKRARGGRAATIHFEWLARRRINGETYYSIAASEPGPKRPSRQNVRAAVLACAALLGLREERG